MQSCTRESRAISRTLDRIGYSSKMVTFRQKVLKKMEQAFCNKLQEMQLYFVYAGSRAEGITTMFKSDLDLMTGPLDVICSKYPPDLLGNKDNKTVFELDMTDTTPGYTLLRLVHLNENENICSDTILHSLVERLPGRFYLSSDIWKNTFQARASNNNIEHGTENEMIIYSRTDGPSCPLSMCNVMDSDVVVALECEYPDYLNAWITRNRSYQWPPAHVKQDVFNSQAHVVPVGFSASGTKSFEWRICFTKGEIKLVQSLNDCLTKVLILLKEIASEILKTLCKDMTSYIMKNVIFWIAETLNYNIFTENNLLFVLQLALQYLRMFIVADNLPSYMIPERNLLANKLTDSQRLKLCMKIDALLGEGPNIVKNSPIMRTAKTKLDQGLEEFLNFYRGRKEAELFALARDCYMFCKCNIFTLDMTLERLVRLAYTDGVLRNLTLRSLRALPSRPDRRLTQFLDRYL